VEFSQSENVRVRNRSPKFVRVCEREPSGLVGVCEPFGFV